ncbi:MAG: AEC family transporter [Bacilli bacterium]|jgi:predicted permease|nr:AEC family transporter [Acholeplasmataceae bacterium]
MDFYLSLSVVAPICIYILLGILVKKLKWIGDTGLSQTNKLIYSLFFPTIMFVNIYNSSIEESFNLRLVLFLLIMYTVVFIILNLIIPIFIKERPVQASVIQGIYRSNSILYAMPITLAIYGPEKVGVAAVCVSIIVPFSNIFCVILLENKRGNKANFGKIALSVIKNPIIIGAIFGLIVKLLNWTLPEIFEKVVVDMSKVVTPLALILLGAGLKYGNIQKNKVYLFFVCIGKLIIIPLVFVLIGYWLGFREIELATIFALSSVPTAVNTYVMAKELGADGDLAGEIVAFTSTFSIITIFLWVLLLTGIGWI